MVNPAANQRKWRKSESSPYTGKLSARPAGKPGDFLIAKESLRRSLLRHCLVVQLPTQILGRPSMRFLRQGEIYRSDVVPNQRQNQNQIPGRAPTASRRSAPSPGKRTRREDHALLIVRDEFRTGYSLIGLLASIARLRFTGTRRLTCTLRGSRRRGHFYFARKGTFLLCLDKPMQSLDLPRHKA
jgi:hypothetical protein